MKAFTILPSRMIYSNIISKTHSHYPQLLGISYKVSEIISLKKFAIFMRKGKQYIMLTLYKHLLEMMTWDNNAFMHMSTHKNIHIFRYNTCIKLGTNLIKPEHTNSENLIYLSHAIILNDNFWRIHTYLLTYLLKKHHHTQASNCSNFLW